MTEDEKFLWQCIHLAEIAFKSGEGPFGSVIVRKNQIIATGKNQTKKQNDVIKHAEIIAMTKAQKLLNSQKLSDCTIYSNCEPCAMCSFAIRELHLKRVVFAISSPIMGGYSKWKILQDKGLSSLRLFFDKPPKISIGILKKEASKIFKKQHAALKKSPAA